MTQTLCCATPHRTHSYHTAPNTLCGFFIPPVKQLFISPSLLSPSPHTCFIFSPTPTSLCLIVSITLLCLHEHFYSFVFLKKNTILHVAYCERCTCINMRHTDCINGSQGFRCMVWITVRSGVNSRDVAIQTGSKQQKVFVTFVHCAGLLWQRVTTLSISGTGVYDNQSKK